MIPAAPVKRRIVVDLSRQPLFVDDPLNGEGGSWIFTSFRRIWACRTA
jgi:hypothetical protein